jgi:HEPN domain-containing protein
MKKKTAEWVKKAEEDHATAAKISRGKPPLHNSVCFHCQQSAEKYLKGLMEELGFSIPKTHNLEDLLNTLLPHHPSLRSLKRGLIILTSYAVEIRYPGESASKPRRDPRLSGKAV